MGVWWHALAFVTHERAKMSHKPGRNVTQAGPKCHTRAKMSHSHVIIIACSSQSLSEPNFNWNIGNNQNTTIYIQENEFENVVCKMVAIWSQPQGVKICEHKIFWQSFQWISHYGVLLKEKQTLCEIMAWYHTGDKPLSKPMLAQCFINTVNWGAQYVP